jgi:predicted alpha/beta-fold hydrolase
VSDVAHSIQHVKERYPAAKLFLAGFSLGAALSLQYLSENHEEVLRRTYASQVHPNDSAYLDSLVATTPLTAALCVSPPWNVTKNSSGIAKLWSRLLATPLKLHYLLHYAYLNEADPERYRQVTLWKLFCCRSLAEVDTLLFSTHYKASGGRYATVAHYYDDISPAHCVHRVVTPTMVLTSRDDPVCVHSNAPSDPDSVGPGLVVVSLLTWSFATIYVLDLACYLQL